MICGGVTPAKGVDAEDLAVWSQCVAKDPSLAALGQPVSVQTQVVAGVNYTFNFANGQKVKVFEQSWTNTLEITEKPNLAAPRAQPQPAPQAMPICGGVSAPKGVDPEALNVWNQAVAKDPTLASLGQPVSVQTQVVAGTNYTFKFANGQSVKVFHQPWTNTLQITEKPMIAAPAAPRPQQQPIICGGVSAPQGVSAEALTVWNKAVQKDPSLASFGQPISVQTQVVAGANYTFKFANNASVTVFEQSWTNTLEITSVVGPSISAGSPVGASPIRASPTGSFGGMMLGAAAPAPTASFGAGVMMGASPVPAPTASFGQGMMLGAAAPVVRR